MFPELIENNDNKKIHIFYLYKSIIELLPIENKEIQIHIKNIMLQTFDIIQIKIPPLPKFNLKEK